jgi:hypothetical protein
LNKGKELILEWVKGKCGLHICESDFLKSGGLAGGKRLKILF